MVIANVSSRGRSQTFLNEGVVGVSEEAGGDSQLTAFHRLAMYNMLIHLGVGWGGAGFLTVGTKFLLHPG